MKELLDKIQHPFWRAFAWRVYNSMVAFVIPNILTAISLFIGFHGITVEMVAVEPSVFFNMELIIWVGYSLIVSLTGSSIAGVAKGLRSVQDLG